MCTTPWRRGTLALVLVPPTVMGRLRASVCRGGTGIVIILCVCVSVRLCTRLMNELMDVDQTGIGKGYTIVVVKFWCNIRPTSTEHFTIR